MKRILIDGRCLLDIHSGGVRRIVLLYIHSLLAHKTDDTEYIIGFTSYSPLPEDLRELPHLHRRIPNKFVILLSFFGLSYERYFSGHFDEIIYPNLDFTAPSATPYRVLVHDLSYLIEPAWYPTKSRLWHFLLRPKRLLKQAAHLDAVSEWTARDLTTLLEIPKEKIHLLAFENFTLSSQQKPIDQLKDKTFFLFLGINNTRKNGETILAAFKRLREQEKNILLVATGDGVAQDGIVYLPWLDDESLSWLFHHAKALLYPSWYEGFGIPLLEAKSAGLPVIASTSSSLPDIGEHFGKDRDSLVLFVPPHQPHLWTIAMQSVIHRESTQ